MKVLLAGFNIDADVVAELRAAAPERADVTPETLAAAYARISRNPRPVDELRAEARAEVERARRSNQTIIFKMGHHSVAEHAVFNFDLIGLSRLAIEEVERFRLCSFTEKSQRYITLGDDFVVPAEVRRAGLEGLFVETVRLQNALYHRLYAKLRPHVLAKSPDLAKEPGNQAVLEGWAKEDARYIVSLATEGQLGMTINARNLELLIRRFAAKDLAELGELNQRIYALAKDVAPSIVLFTDPTPFDARTYAEVGEEAARSRPPAGRRRRSADVRLVDATPDADLKILAALLHTVTARPYGDVLEEARCLPPARRKALFRAALRRMEFYDFPLREFEHAALTFELVVSASCFAQLKRHRMATLTCQPYDPALGVTIPPSVVEAGAAGEFREVIERTDAAYDVLKKACGAAAAYVLTNAHRRRVLIHLNVRELYHLSRLREDATAQWEIRAVAARMSALARRVMPLAGLLLGGKDAYPELYERVFGARPSLAPPRFLK
jgi:flavin-dependent thymidylate synthase